METEIIVKNQWNSILKTKTDKTLVNLTKREKEKTQISKIRDERRYIMTDMMKFRKLLGYTLKSYITLNQKV